MSLPPEQAEHPHFLCQIFAVLTFFCCTNFLAPFFLMFHRHYKWCQLTYLFLLWGAPWLPHSKAGLTCLCDSILLQKHSSCLAPMIAASAKMLRVIDIELSSHLSGDGKTLYINALTLYIFDMWVLVPKIPFYNCAEMKLTNSCLIHERKGKRVVLGNPGQ